jgi:hypothetical protein
MAEGWDLPRIVRDGKSFPCPPHLGGLFSFFVFKDITVHEAGLIDGYVAGQWGDHTITVNGLSANLTPERILEAGAAFESGASPKGWISRFLAEMAHRPPHLPTRVQRSRQPSKGKISPLRRLREKFRARRLKQKCSTTAKKKTLHFESFRIVSDAVTLHEGTEACLFLFLSSWKQGPTWIFKRQN